jgi:site-specific DNA-methyltransferase (adenine-specific)
MTITLYNGDCLEVMKDLSANSIDCFICDLPYGCLAGGDAIGKGKLRKEASGLTGCTWDIKLDLPAFWEQVKRLARDDHTPVLMFCTTKFGFELHASNPSWFRYDLVWDKCRGVSFLSANKMPMRSHEMIYVFSKKGAAYTRVDISGDFPEWSVKRGGKTTGTYGAVRTDTTGGNGTRCVTSVVRSSGHQTRKKGQHPTEKPVELYKWLLERYCPAGGTVLDPTFGSCNSGRAAIELGMNYVGIEKDNTFFTKAQTLLDSDDTIQHT